MNHPTLMLLMTVEPELAERVADVLAASALPQGWLELAVEHGLVADPLLAAGVVPERDLVGVGPAGHGLFGHGVLLRAPPGATLTDTGYSENGRSAGSAPSGHWA